MASRQRHDGPGKARGSKSDLINHDHRNELNPLKQDVLVRKAGGLFLSPNGVKIEIPPGASSGRRERLLCAPVPSTARGVLGPWLGPDLRMASDIQLFYAPHSFRQPVALFIPFSYAAARELTYQMEEEPSSTERQRFKIEPAGKDATDGDTAALQHTEAPSSVRAAKVNPKGKQPFSPISAFLESRKTNRPPLLDTRSVFLLRCKVGEDEWDTIENFTVIQPTIHYNSWPPEIQRLSGRSARWCEDKFVEPAADSDPTPFNHKRLSAAAPRNKRGTAPTQKDVDPVEQIKQIENYCGGVCIATDELKDLLLLVIGTRAENFLINREGGLFRSPLLHPFLSVRIPKRSCLTPITTSFKAMEIRANWSQAAVQFDPQLAEVEGCSDIYEIGLSNVVLRRPSTVRIPLPKWFIERRNKAHDNWEQASTTAGSSEPQEPSAHSRTAVSDGTFNYERPLMLLYQSSGHRRQIVWQVATLDDIREDVGRRKSRFQVSRKDTLNTQKCKIDNLYARLGWSHLTAGIRGGPWHTMKQPLYFTKRTAFFETNIFGKFVLIGARDPERTPANKLAHLMTRVEALAFAPPGALIIFLQLQPNCWRIMANIYPEEHLADAVQEQVYAGFIPLVQMASGLTRRTVGLCNAVIQAADTFSGNSPQEEHGKIRKIRPYRVNGTDINHVLMYSGLCLEFRFTGDVRMRTTSQFEPLSYALRNVKLPESDGEQGRSGKRSTSLSLLDDQRRKDSTPVKRDITSLLTTTACLQQHELLHETACVVEIEPILNEEARYGRKSREKSQFVTELIRNALKKQESSEDFDDDDSSSDDNGGRRSSLSESQQPIPYQGDDTEVDDIVREAQELVIRDQPLSVAAINAELSRRLFNVIEKNKINRSSAFLQKVHNMYHAGTVEVWLVPPKTLSQLAVPKEPARDVAHKTDAFSTIGSEAGQATSGSEMAAQEEQSGEIVESEHQDADEQTPDDINEETHNAVRWNPVGSAANTDGKAVHLPEMAHHANKPLAVYNILIDPDLALSYVRTPATRSAASPTNQKKGGHGTPRSSGRSPKTRQRNVSAAGRRRAAATAVKTVPVHSYSADSEPESTRDEVKRRSNSPIADELRNLTKPLMQSIAGYIREPEKLLGALGLPQEESDRIRAQMAQQNEPSPKYIAYETIKTWKSCYMNQRIQLVASRCGSTTAGDNRTETTGSRSPLNDLMDVLQSLGYFEAAELISQIKLEDKDHVDDA
ncbi:hypothetical protein CSKR_111982 [Clonorchis sinensis]|uniref:Uncharacterized protein n=1 Tax=Clonorchis sinensis TaxID=79923 RepID=A0A8T1MW39_CLOSI|nr:hypothetical protein CSKR_111982 [Clonorchis sinensis]